MISNFALLTGQDIQNLQPDLTVFLFPVGGCEGHGPHLPMGTKLLQAEIKTGILAKRLFQLMPDWNFILMPVLPLTVDTITTRIALQVRPHVVRDALVDQAESLKRLGFSHFLAYSSHLTPRQLSAVEDASRIVSKRKWGLFGEASIMVSVTSALVDSKTVWKSPMIAIPEEHAGAKDTAFVMKHQPGWKQYGSMPAPQSKPEPGASRFLSYFQNELEGYWGNPAEAKPEAVDVEIERETEELAQKLLPVLQQGKGLSFFHSGYRYFPLNGSFFKAYLFAAIFFVIMFMWVMLSLKDVFDAS